jgi:hypothetical protein
MVQQHFSVRAVRMSLYHHQQQTGDVVVKKKELIAFYVSPYIGN